jgi:hypothetical protein
MILLFAVQLISVSFGFPGLTGHEKLKFDPSVILKSFIDSTVGGSEEIKDIIFNKIKIKKNKMNIVQNFFII